MGKRPMVKFGRMSIFGCVLLLSLSFVALLRKVDAVQVIEPTTERVSVATDGSQANDGQFGIQGVNISGDGRYVVFHSTATNLVPEDTNGHTDVFVYDRSSDTMQRVSVDSAGLQGNGGSAYPGATSSDGRFVAFQSYATNLVDDDTNDVRDVFLHDLETGETSRVSVNSARVQGNAPSGGGNVSGNGRYVAFDSNATNLVDGVSGLKIYAHDRQIGETSLVSVASDGTPANSTSWGARPSSDGQRIAFASYSSNLVTETTYGLQVFIHDRQTGETRLASRAPDGAPANSGIVDNPAISSDGRYVAFCSVATNLGAGGGNDWGDVFVYDSLTGSTEHVADGLKIDQYQYTECRLTLSDDGRFIAFPSMANDLVADDDNDAQDGFVLDRATGHIQLVSVSADGIQGNGNSWEPAISGNGQFVAFSSIANNLVPGDTNGEADVFVRGPLNWRAPVSVLINPSFEDGTSPWVLHTDGQGSFTTVPDPYWGTWSGQVHLVEAGSNVQLYQSKVSLKPNTTYHLAFVAKSNNGNNMSLSIHKHGYPYTHYGLTDFEVDLKPIWKWYNIEFTTRGFSSPVDDARLRFWFGPYDEDGTIYSIDHVLLYEAEGYVPPLPPPPDPPLAPPEGHCDDAPPGILANPGFEAGTLPWRFYTDKEAWFKVVTPGYECTRTSRINIVNPGNNVQLYQTGFRLEPKTTYRLRLAAKSTGGQNLELFLHKHRTPYTKYGLNGVVLDLTEEWQVFQVQFTTTGFNTPVSDARLRFSLGDWDEAGAQYFIDDVILAKTEDLAVSAASLSSGLSVTEMVSGFFIDANDAGRLAGASVPEGTPPVCTDAYATPDILWPANNKFVEVAIQGVTDPDGDATEVVVTGISQDEPVGGEADAVIADSVVQLRAERDGGGDGRIYEIVFNVSDTAGEACSGRAFVAVPHDKAGHAIDGGHRYDSTTASEDVKASSFNDENYFILLPIIQKN